MGSQRSNGFRFTLREMTGSLGDIGTLLPLKVAAMIAIATGASLGEIRATAYLMGALLLVLSVSRVALTSLSELVRAAPAGGWTCE